MRKLFILRGVMGSGKSTFIKENNLDDYTLNPDKIRLMYNSPEMNINYRERIPQFNNNKVWNLTFKILEDRMRDGELTVIDAMHIYETDLLRYKTLAEKYRYKIYIVDFTDVEYEELLNRNSQRDTKKWVPEELIKKLYEDLKNEKISDTFEIIKPYEFNKIINISPKNVDLYKKVHIFGDICGYYSILENYFKNNLINDNELYIFIGNYFGRGFENLKMFEFIKNNLAKNNFIFLSGNCEEELYKYANDDEYKLDYVLEKTLEELSGKINKGEIKDLIKGFEEIANIEYIGKQYVITHAGIPYYPEKSLDFYRTNYFIYGFDNYDVDIDNIYNEFMTKQTKKVYQIHGHTNCHSIDYNKYKYSYNLKESLENSEYLRVLILNADETVDFKSINNNYDSKLVEK